MAPLNKDIDKNRDTANIGLESSVGRAPARESGGRWFKSNSRQFFVQPQKTFLFLLLLLLLLISLPEYKIVDPVQ